MSEQQARGQYITAVVLYGTIGLALHFIQAPSELVALCRGVIGTAVILLLFKSKGRSPDRQALRKNAGLLLLSGACLGLNWIFLFAAYRVTTVAIASLCNYMAPIVVVLIAPLVLKDRLNGKKLLCVAAAFVGIVLVSGLPENGLSGINRKGLLLGLLAAACFVGIVLCNKKIVGMDGLEKAAAQLFVSAVTVLPYVILANGGIPFPRDARSLLLIALLGVVHTGIAYIFYFNGMGKLPVQSLAVLGYLEPVISVLTSALILKEPMTPLGGLGAAMIVIAAAASELL